MKKVIKRLFYGLLFALPLMALAFSLVHVTARAQEAQSTSAPFYDCKLCHSETQRSWEAGAHGHATSDPVFMQTWEAQGKPDDCMKCHSTGFDPLSGAYKEAGVTCEACHGQPPDNHPTDPMPAERSAKLCGQCHTETFFEWQASKHRSANLDCQDCHDPHGTKLKAEDTSELCASCHRETASNYAHSAHSSKGLTCVDCHLAKLPGDGQEGHARLDHSFNVSLSTCNSCHAYQMHDPSQVHPENTTPAQPDAMSAIEKTPVAEQPQPINPLGFTTLSGLIGLAAGIVLAPWLERWTRRRQ